MDTPNSTTKTRVCRVCGIEYPLTREHFLPYQDGKYHSLYCRKCNRAAQRAKRDRAKETTRGAAYRANNKDKIAAYNKDYRKRNVERRKAYNNKWNAEHREHVRATEKAYKQRRPEVRQGIKARRRDLDRAAEESVSTADLAAIRAAQTDKKGRLICWKCGEPITETPHLDHWIPMKRGGPSNPGNLHYMHAHCNLTKSAKHPTEIGRLL